MRHEAPGMAAAALIGVGRHVVDPAAMAVMAGEDRADDLAIQASDKQDAVARAQAEIDVRVRVVGKFVERERPQRLDRRAVGLGERPDREARGWRNLGRGHHPVSTGVFPGRPHSDQEPS